MLGHSLDERRYTRKERAEQNQWHRGDAGSERAQASQECFAAFDTKALQ